MTTNNSYNSVRVALEGQQRSQDLEPKQADECLKQALPAFAPALLRLATPLFTFHKCQRMKTVSLWDQRGGVKGCHNSGANFNHPVILQFAINVSVSILASVAILGSVAILASVSSLAFTGRFVL